MNFPHRPPCAALLAGALLAGTLSSPVLADEPPPPSAAEAEVPPDWVAQCGGQVLTVRGLALAVVRRVKHELLENSSGPLTILQQMVEERVVVQEARRLGLEVTDVEIDAQMKQLDGEVRKTSGGSKTLVDVIEKDMRMTLREFRSTLRHQMRKEEIAGHASHLGATLPKDPKDRLAQAEVVIGELTRKADVKHGLPTTAQPEPAALGPGIVATVNGEGITLEQYGRECIRRLPAERILQVVHQECKAVLTAGMALSEKDMDGEIRRERANWDRWREMSRDEVWRNVSYDDRVRARFGIEVDDVKKDRFFRGYFGLLRFVRDQVRPEEVRKEWDEKKDTVWGAAIRISDVQIGFLQKNALVTPPGSRELKDARKLAREVLVQREQGQPFEQIMRLVNQRRDPTFAAGTRRLRNTDDDRILYDHAKGMKDGDVALVETLAAVHVIRREGSVPAPAFEEVQHLILEGIASRRAEEWLDQRLKDPEVVKIRWPLPEDLRVP